MKEFLEVGRIVNTHGIKGDVKVELWCDSYPVFRALKEVFTDGKAYKITKNSPYKDAALIHLEGIDDCDKAELLKGKVLLARRSELNLPEDRVFIADIIGLPVRDEASGREYGILRDVSDGAASQLYEIEKDGKTYYMPAIKEFIGHIEEDAIYITPPEGLFE